MKPLPKISIVTPSFNQAEFLEQTLDSVLGQNYPNLEYIVIDGGSTDSSAQILRKYEKYLTYWQSQPDAGQADAIMTGFQRATGDILAWINSDDFYFPKTLEFVAEQLDPRQSQVLFGNCFHFVEGQARGMTSDVVLKHAERRLDLFDYLIQPSTFWTRRLTEKIGGLNKSLHFAFDWEWFIRAEKSGAEFLATARYLSAYRIHAKHKTSTGGEARALEIREVYSRYQSAQMLEIIDFCRKNYRWLDRWRRRFRRWPLFKKQPAELFLTQISFFQLRNVRPEELRDILDMIAP